MRVGWSADFIVVDGERPAAGELARIRASSAAWVLVEREGGHLRYVFGRRELLSLPPLRWLLQQGADLQAMPLKEALNLRESKVSEQVPDARSATPRPPDPGRPSAARHVRVDPQGVPLSVGGTDVPEPRPVRGLPTDGLLGGGRPPGPPPSPLRMPAPGVARAGATADEGTMPERYPSIEPAGPLAAGAPIVLVVDLQAAESAATFGAVMLPAQPVEWTELPVDVVLQSPDIDFDGGGLGTLTVVRNAATLPARIGGRVHAGLPAGHVCEIKARFLIGTRHCGSAARRLPLDGGPAAPDAAPLQATVQLDAAAEPPDLTVFITLFDRSAPGRLHWRMVTPPFPGSPPKLDGLVDLGRRPDEEASALFKQFAKLERGRHTEAIEGFGETLWRRAPAEFQALYWALCDHRARPLAIQFVSDDPHLPWELMSPFRDGESHGPLALRHAVARWIGGWAGYMRNRLPGGRLLAVAPHYKSASATLSLAEAAAQGLVDQLGATRLPGTREALLGLLEQPAGAPVALLYFTGHGAFAADAAAVSLIKLEDGAQLSALEVGRQKVRLGERDGTVVFLNACEVGATAAVLGGVGGWADAFLSRRFGAFIAPLWAIDEEDASQVTAELMQAIVVQRQPIGSALRDLRSRHGGVSPTFYSYLLYGDVTARLGSA